MGVSYLHLPVGREPPSIVGARPFKAFLVLDQPADDEWQTLVSDWLVRSGCLYMMAWGTGCSSWDDSVDWASMAASDFQEVPDDQFVMTTWHDAEPLSETFWFAGHAAQHSTVPISDTLIVDVSAIERETLMLVAYSDAQKDD